MMRRFGLATIIILLYIGCGSNHYRDLTDWYSPANPPLWVEGQKMDAALFFEVDPKNYATAEKALSTSACTEVNGELLALVPKDRITPMGKHAYIVRAVKSDDSTGRFNLWSKSGELQVNFGALGKPERCFKAALIVFLDAPPKKVYTSFNAAQ